VERLHHLIEGSHGRFHFRTEAVAPAEVVGQLLDREVREQQAAAVDGRRR